MNFKVLRVSDATRVCTHHIATVNHLGRQLIVQTLDTDVTAIAGLRSFEYGTLAGAQSSVEKWFLCRTMFHGVKCILSRLMFYRIRALGVRFIVALWHPKSPPTIQTRHADRVHFCTQSTASVYGTGRARTPFYSLVVATIYKRRCNVRAVYGSCQFLNKLVVGKWHPVTVKIGPITVGQVGTAVRYKRWVWSNDRFITTITFYLRIKAVGSLGTSS